MFLIFFKITESENRQVEECIRPVSCEQVCTKCKLKDIEDCVEQTDAVIETESSVVEHVEDVEDVEDNSENLIEFENNNEEKETKNIGQEETENLINEVNNILFKKHFVCFIFLKCLNA